MKNLLLLAFALFSLSAVAQRIEPLDPPGGPPQFSQWKSYTFYNCDEYGRTITDSSHPNYKKHEVEILIISPPPSGILYTTAQQVRDAICATGKIPFSPSVRYKMSEGGGPFTPPIIIFPDFPTFE